jgi:hypothetical protein
MVGTPMEACSVWAFNWLGGAGVRSNVIDENRSWNERESNSAPLNSGAMSDKCTGVGPGRRTAYHTRVATRTNTSQSLQFR